MREDEDDMPIDEPLAERLKALQRRLDVEPGGVIGPDTLSKLEGR